jgi:hypothetical protein
VVPAHGHGCLRLPPPRSVASRPAPLAALLALPSRQIEVEAGLGALRRVLAEAA